MLPSDPPENSCAYTKYFYIDEENITKSSKEEMVIYEYTAPKSGLTTVFSPNAEKIGTLSIKESNYFNAIQSLCEKFECWADF